MINPLEKFRLYWWKRSYRKIWESSLFKARKTFSTETKEECDDLVRFVSGNLKYNNDSVVLDVGCGNGNLGEKVFGNCGLLVQTDFSFGALKTIDTGKGNQKRYIVQSDAGGLPFKEGVFDYIFMYGVILNAGSVKNTRVWLEKAIRLLKQGGRLYLGDVPIKERLYRELLSRFKKIRSFNDLKYFFAEFMQVSYALKDFSHIAEVGHIKVFEQPPQVIFSRWRLDIEIERKF